MSHSHAADATTPLPGLLKGGVVWRTAALAAGFLALWLQAITQLSAEWNVNPQYSYGWTVPFLAFFLFWQRWGTRPAPAPPVSRSVTLVAGMFGALLLFPVRIVAVANPDWRMLSWLVVLVVTFITLCGVNLAGGKPWLRHFAFPVAFFAVATPWPTQFEQLVVQTLMRADARIAVETLNAIGILALQQGNVIELSTGTVGIDEACTSIRSLQATFMISLFLGELYRMSLSRRLLLVVAGVSLAFFCNIVRTLILCIVAARSGISAISTWHDPAGLTILLVCLGGLWVLSLFLRNSSADEPSQGTPAAPVSLPLLASLALGLALWLGFTEICVASWYKADPNQAKRAEWTTAWPTAEPAYKDSPVPEAAQNMLRYNEGGGASWRSADNHQWMMFSFRWLPGRTAALFVRNHRPDVCLPASGMTLRKDEGLQLIPINGMNLPFRSYRFEANGRPIHVFYCYWDGRSSYDTNADAEEDWSPRGRLRSAWNGKREVGTQMLQLAVWDYEEDAEARHALVGQLEKIVRPN